MIIELLIKPLFLLCEFIISLLTFSGSIPRWSVDFLTMISKALCYFPADVFCAIVLNIYAWVVLQFSWAVIEWVYKKIPGVS